jgi:hypothetical protein
MPRSGATVTDQPVPFLARVESWRRDADRLIGATCTQVGAAFWFPEPGHVGREERLARSLCFECPVRRQCLRIALESEDKVTEYGVWAGYTARPLRRMRRLLALLALCPPKTGGNIAPDTHRRRSPRCRRVARWPVSPKRSGR